MSALTNLEQLLCPPGCGVFTVNTAKEKKAGLHQRLYGGDEADFVEQQYKQQLQNFIDRAGSAEPALLGICSDTGGGIQRGANWGPLFIREKLQLGNYAESYLDIGDVRVIPHLLHDKYINQTTLENCRQALYPDQSQYRDLPVSPLSIAENALDLIYELSPNQKILALGGDHSVSYPLVKSFLKAKNAQGIRCGLIHFDAHTDLLETRLGIDICFGSWLTHVLSDFQHPNDVAQFGIRSTARSKDHWQQTFGIKQYWASEIVENGITEFCQQTIENFKANGVDEIYISFDIDALDASIASATGTPEFEGLRLEDCLIAINLFASAFPITGADLVEVAPMVNPNFSPKEPESTLLAAQRLCEALLNHLAR